VAFQTAPSIRLCAIIPTARLTRGY